jgi:hypothetical protein
MVKGLRFEAYGLRFRVQGFGFMVWKLRLGFRVTGKGSTGRIWNLGLLV